MILNLFLIYSEIFNYNINKEKNEFIYYFLFKNLIIFYLYYIFYCFFLNYNTFLFILY